MSPCRHRIASLSGSCSRKPCKFNIENMGAREHGPSIHGEKFKCPSLVSCSPRPRKFNICVVGSHDLYEHPHINDLAFLPLSATQLGLSPPSTSSSSETPSSSSSSSPVVGFQLLVGGFFSSKRCEEAVPLGVWVPADPAAVTAAAAAVVGAFRDLGLRTDRQRARLMWLIDHLVRREGGMEGRGGEGRVAVGRMIPSALNAALLAAVFPRWR